MSIIPEHFWSCSGGDEQLVTYIRVGDKMTVTQGIYNDGNNDEVPEDKRVRCGMIFRPLKVPGVCDEADDYDPNDMGCFITFKDEAALDTVINQLIDLKGCLNGND